MVKVAESNKFFFGLIPQRISIPTKFFGMNIKLCKHFFFNRQLYYITTINYASTDITLKFAGSLWTMFQLECIETTSGKK